MMDYSDCLLGSDFSKMAFFQAQGLELRHLEGVQGQVSVFRFELL